MRFTGRGADMVWGSDLICQPAGALLWSDFGCAGPALSAVDKIGAR